MSTWNTNSVMLTEQGELMYSQASTGQQLTLTKIAVGNQVVPIEDLYYAEEVSGLQMYGDFSGVKNTSGSSIVTVSISNTSITPSFEIKQIGIYAKVGAGGEALYMIAQCSADPDNLPLYEVTPITYTYDFVLGHSSDLSITFSQPPTGLVTLEDVKPLVDLVQDSLLSHILGGY